MRIVRDGPGQRKTRVNQRETRVNRMIDELCKAQSRRMAKAILVRGGDQVVGPQCNADTKAAVTLE